MNETAMPSPSVCPHPRRAGSRALSRRITCVPNFSTEVIGSNWAWPPGEARFLAELAGRVEQVEVLQFNRPIVGQSTLMPLPALDNLTFRVSRFDNENRLWKAASYVRMLPRVACQAARADFSYLFYPSPLSRLYAAVCIRRNRPFGLYVRTRTDWESPWNRGILSRAAFVLTSGLGYAEEARRFCPRVDAVSPMLGIPLDVCPPARSFAPARPQKLLFVGTMTAAKGLGEIYAACRQLMAENVPFELDLIGPVYEDSPVHPGRMDEALSRCTRWHGPITDPKVLAEFYRSADLFLLPSHTEAFPRVIYEAMYYGLPIVTTFVGCIGTVCEDRRNCLRVQVGDAHGLTAAIRTLLADDDLRRTLSGGAQATMDGLLPRFRKSHAQQVVEMIAASDPSSTRRAA